MKKRRIETTVYYAECGQTQFDVLLDDDMYEETKRNLIMASNCNGKKSLNIKRSDGKVRNLARYILDLKDSGVYVRHRDGDFFNCTRGNLYTITRKRMNISSNRNPIYKGVNRIVTANGCERFIVNVWAGGRYYYIGRYDTQEMAGSKYDAAVDYIFRNENPKDSETRHKNFPSQKCFLDKDEIYKINERIEYVPCKNKAV